MLYLEIDRVFVDVCGAYTFIYSASCFLAILYVDTNNFKIVVFVIVMLTYGIFRHVYVINKSFCQNIFFILCFSQQEGWKFRYHLVVFVNPLR